jgi:hypothetical protein
VTLSRAKLIIEIRRDGTSNAVTSSLFLSAIRQPTKLGHVSYRLDVPHKTLVQLLRK